MSSDLRAEAIIELETGSVEQGSKRIQKEFQNVEKEATDSLQNVEDAMQDVGDQAGRMGDEVKQGAEKGEKAVDDLGDSVKDVDKDMTEAAVSAIGLAQGFAGISDAAFGAQEKLVTIQRSAFGLSVTQRDLNREIEDFQIAVQEGTLSGLEYQRALEDIQFGLRDMAIEQEEVRTEQEALNSEFISMALNIGQVAALSAITLKDAFKKMTVENLRATASTISHSGALKTLGFNFAGASAAMKGATFSLSGFRAGLRATVLALGPIGIAITAVSVAWAAWDANVFGVQDKLKDLWETIKQFIPTLQILETLVKSIFPQEAEAAVEDYSTSLEELKAQFDSGQITAEQFAEALGGVQTTAMESQEVLTGFDIVLGSVSATTEEATERTKSLSGAVSGVPDWYKKATTSIQSNNKALEKNAELYRKAGQAIQEFKKKAEEAALEVDPNTGEPQEVQRRKGFLDPATFQIINDFDPSIGGNFRAFNGPGRVMTPRLRQQLAREAELRKQRSLKRSKSFKLNKLREGFNDADVVLAQLLGLVPNIRVRSLSSGFHVLQRARAAGRWARSVFARAGITIPPEPKFPRPMHRLSDAQKQVRRDAPAVYGARLRALFETAKERVEKRDVAEGKVNRFISGETSDIGRVSPFFEFLDETFDLEEQTQIDFAGRSAFIERTQKEQLISSTV